MTTYLTLFRCHLSRKPPPMQDPGPAFLHRAFCIILKLSVYVSCLPRSVLRVSSWHPQQLAQWLTWSGHSVSVGGTKMSPSLDLLVPPCHACHGIKCHCQMENPGPEDPGGDVSCSGVIASSFLSLSSFSQ